MRILMLGWEFPPYISGGLGTACQGIAKGLIEEHIAITLVLPQVPDAGLGGIEFLSAEDVAPLSVAESKIKEKLYSGFEDLITVESCINPYFDEEEYQFQKARVMQLSQQQQRQEYDRGKIYLEGQYGDNLLAEVSRFARVGTRLGLRGKYDIIYAHDWMTMLAGVEAANQSATPLVLHIHSTEYDRNSTNPNQQIIDIEKFAMQKADMLVTVSNRSKDVLINHYAIKPKKISVVYNALTQVKIDNTLLDDSHKFKEKLILFMGRITEQKGPEFFIKAAKKVLQHNSNLRFIMAGCGDQLPKMIELVATERMERHFHFTGFLRGEEVHKIFNLCDLFVMPSVSEPFGLVPLEAMGYGLPTIISKQSGVAEILSNAIKVDFWDTDAISQSILSALDNDELGEKSADEVKNLSWGSPAKQLKNIFETLVKRF